MPYNIECVHTFKKSNIVNLVQPILGTYFGVFKKKIHMYGMVLTHICNQNCIQK